MRLSETIDDVVAQAAGLLSPPDMSGWEPPADATADVQARMEQEEYDRRAQAKIDRYLADRADRLLCLRAIREQAQARAAHYDNQAAPWSRMAERQKRIAEYCERRAFDVLVAERSNVGLPSGEPYTAVLPNGLKMRIKVTSVVQVSDIDALPGNLVRTKTTREPDKLAIKKLLGAGQEVPGAALGTNEHLDWGR